MEWIPHEGQIRAVRFLIEHAGAGLFASPGTGKTSAAYAAFEFLRRRGVARKALVISPLRPAQLVWPVEAKKWNDFANLRIELLHGDNKDQALAREAEIYVINPDGLKWLFDPAISETADKARRHVDVNLAHFKSLGFDTLIVDELSQFKNTNSLRFKMLRAVLPTFRRRWGLTGSPASNGLLDLFGQIYILDRGNAFSPYVTHYRSKYFLPAWNGFGWTLRRGAEEEIYERLRPLVLRLEASDYVDMPDLIENTIVVDLPPMARRVYDALENNFIVKVADGTVTAANAAVASIKLRQAASGGLYLDPETTALFRQKPLIPQKTRDWALLHDAKTDALEELIGELQGVPLLVAYEFQHDLDRIRARFGEDIPVIGGGTSAKRAAELERLWNTGQLPILFGHPASIGHGLNLQHAGNQLCWYSLTFDLENYLQFNHRIVRQGSAHQHVFVHHIVARGTIDEIIMKALKQKMRVQDLLLDALKDRVAA